MGPVLLLTAAPETARHVARIAPSAARCAPHSAAVPEAARHAQPAMVELESSRLKGQAAVKGTPLKNGEKPIANPFVILREEFDDWAVLFDPDTGHGFGLNPTGVYIWKLLDGKHSIEDMLSALRRDTPGSTSRGR